MVHDWEVFEFFALGGTVPVVVTSKGSRPNLFGESPSRTADSSSPSNLFNVEGYCSVTVNADQQESRRNDCIRSIVLHEALSNMVFIVQKCVKYDREKYNTRMPKSNDTAFNSHTCIRLVLTFR